MVVHGRRKKAAQQVDLVDYRRDRLCVDRRMYHRQLDSGARTSSRLLAYRDELWKRFPAAEAVAPSDMTAAYGAAVIWTAARVSGIIFDSGSVPQAVRCATPAP